jgi:hypothetical protein
VGKYPVGRPDPPDISPYTPIKWRRQDAKQLINNCRDTTCIPLNSKYNKKISTLKISTLFFQCLGTGVGLLTIEADGA